MNPYKHTLTHPYIHIHTHTHMHTGKIRSSASEMARAQEGTGRGQEETHDQVHGVGAQSHRDILQGERSNRHEHVFVRAWTAIGSYGRLWGK